MGFSVGGAATATMVTAILPALTHARDSAACARTPARHAHGPRQIPAPSISSELTITPARYRTTSPKPAASELTPAPQPRRSTSHLAGLVGVFTGVGALVSLVLFLPLPAHFAENGASASDAVAYSFYTVGAVAIAVALLSFIGLRQLPGEAHKSLRNIVQDKHNPRASSPPPTPVLHSLLSYPRALGAALVLGARSRFIFLAYVGGFLARASSVAISAFIPLFVNAYFLRTGRCSLDAPNDPDVKHDCRRAYILAASLTGVSQLVALLCAPLFGWLGAHYPGFAGAGPISLAAVTGVAGYTAFGLLRSPDPRDEDGSAGIYLIGALIGISQIGAIVCSLALLGRGINEDDSTAPAGGEEVTDTPNGAMESRPLPGDASVGADVGTTTPDRTTPSPMQTQETPDESTALLGGTSQREQPEQESRSNIRGAVAGCYSLFGGAGILLLNKAGGALFDSDPGAPFFMMAAFNLILLLVGLTLGLFDKWSSKREEEAEYMDPVAEEEEIDHGA